MGAFVKGVRVSIGLLFVSFQHVTLLTQTLNMMVKNSDSTKSFSVVRTSACSKGYETSDQ